MLTLLSGLFFSLTLIGGLVMVATMLRAEWTRVVAILSGQELQRARNVIPQVRVRNRAWRAETRLQARPPHAAAA